MKNELQAPVVTEYPDRAQHEQIIDFLEFALQRINNVLYYRVHLRAFM